LGDSPGILRKNDEITEEASSEKRMSNQSKAIVKKLVAGTLLTATGVLTSVTLSTLSAKAQIGGGGTCTPHPVTYQQYIPGRYDSSGNWIPSHYETRTRMSTECNMPDDQPLPPDNPVISNITGAWRTNNQNSNALTFISQNGSDSYLLKNEFGSTSSAYMVGDRIYAPDWQVSGQLLNNGQLIVWSNGTAWSRNSTNPPSPPTGRTRDLGPIEFAPGDTSASVSNFVRSNSIDRYTFNASAGQPATVNVDSQTGRVRLALIAPNGRALRYDSPSWVGTLPQDGTYQLEVRNRSMGSRYTVNLNIQPGGAQILNRGVIQFPPGGTYAAINGYLAPQNTDRYTFVASAGQPANLTVNSPDGQVLLTLVDPNGYPLVRSQSGASSWSGTLPASGTYRVDVVNPSGASRYTLRTSIRGNLGR
jgi:hypothetical protein